LHHSKQEKQGKVGCDPAQEGTDCEKHNARQKEPLPPKPSDQPSADGQNDRVRDQIARQYPGALVIASAQIARDVRQGHIRNAGIEHLHERRQ
jgi:hypothetical protein